MAPKGSPPSIAAGFRTKTRPSLFLTPPSTAPAGFLCWGCFFSRAESREQRAESREQRAESREQRAESREQRAESRERRAESGEQRTENGERRTVFSLES